MGQSLKKLAPGSEEKKIEEIGTIIDTSYEKYFKFDPSKEWNFAEFYRGVCGIVEDINQQLGKMQIKVPNTETLKTLFYKHHKGGGSLTRDEFQKILKEAIVDDGGFTGMGAKEALLCIFGVPVTALFIKERVMPKAIPNEFFIPGITSITVLILAGLNKI